MAPDAWEGYTRTGDGARDRGGPRQRPGPDVKRMQCLFCGKELNVLRELTDGEFCSRQHRVRYKKLTQLALKRLTGEPAAAVSKERGAAPGGAGVPPVAGLRLPAGGIFQFCRPTRSSCTPQAAPEAQFSVCANGASTLRGSTLTVQVLNTPAFRQPALCALPSYQSPIPALRLEPGCMAPAPLKVSPVRPSLGRLAGDEAWRPAGAAETVRSHRPYLVARGLRLEARPPAAVLLGAESSGWRSSNVVLPRAAGPHPVLATGLRTGGLYGVVAAPVAARRIAREEAEPQAFPAPVLKRPQILPLASRPAPLPARPAGGFVAGKTMAAKPISSGPSPGLTANALLPALASLFRYGQAPSAPAPAPKPGPPVAAHNRPYKPLAFGASPFPAPGLVLYRRNALSIVETFQYVKPVEEPVMHWLQSFAQLWGRIPAYVRYATAGASLMLLLWVAFPGLAVADLLGMRLGRIEETLRSRATVEITEDFSTGMQNWRGQEDWSRSWRVEKAGYVRPGKLALFEPSMKMDNYRVEFLVQIERQAVSWAYRAKDENNYYAAKIRLVRSGPLPLFTLVRYTVIGGEAGPRVEIPIRVMLHNGVPYRVQISANGNDFSTAIEGQLVDFWRDDLFRSGGFGFFADSGERARIYWMKLSQREDFVGRICAYLIPSALETRSATRFQ